MYYPNTESSVKFLFFNLGKRHSDRVQTTRGHGDLGDQHVLYALRPKFVGLDHHLHAQQRAAANGIRIPTPSTLDQCPDRRARGTTVTRVWHVPRRTSVLAHSGGHRLQLLHADRGQVQLESSLVRIRKR